MSKKKCCDSDNNALAVLNTMVTRKNTAREIPRLAGKKVRLVTYVSRDLYEKASELGIDMNELTRMRLREAVALLEDEEIARAQKERELRA